MSLRTFLVPFAPAMSKRLLVYKKTSTICTTPYFQRRLTMEELEQIEAINWTWFLFPSHVVELVLEVTS